MNRIPFFCLFVVALLFAQNAAAVQDARDKAAVERVESPKEIIERLHRQMEKANICLKDEADPGEPTRKIQGEIIDDLEKLIRQRSEQPAPPSGSKSASKLGKRPAATSEPRKAVEKPHAEKPVEKMKGVEGDEPSRSKVDPVTDPGKTNVWGERHSFKERMSADALPNERYLPPYARLLEEFFRNRAQKRR